MSKFFITNCDRIFRKVKEEVAMSAYKEAFEIKANEGVYAITTKKLSVDNQNGVQCDEGFAIVTGTMSWDEGEAISSAVLQNIYMEFDGDVNKIRAKSIGNFAAIIAKEKVIYVFSEFSGFYNIFYYNSEDVWFVSNSLFDMASVLSEKLTLNKLAFVESIVQDGILLDDTFYNEIHRLSGYNYLKIENNKLKVLVSPTDPSRASGNLKEKIERYTTIQRDYGRKMSNAYGAPAISMTGGLDARMVLSSYLAAGITPHLFYGTGNSFVTNTYDKDKEIDKIFSEKYGLTFYDEKWTTPEPIDRDWNECLSLYGFHYDTYAGSSQIIESIKNTPCQLFTYGYCGELLRNLPWIEAQKKNYFTLDEYIDEFYITKRVRDAVVKIDDYYDYIKSKQMKICEHYHLDVNHIALEDIFFLSLERRKSADALMLNHVNLIKYCCYTLSQYESLMAGRVSFSDAENSGFMLRCLDQLYPSVLDVPVFSHCTIREFFRETMSLTPQNRPLSRSRRVKNYVKSRSPWLITALRGVTGKKYSWRFPMDEKAFNYLIEKDEEDMVKGLLKKNNLDPRRLTSYIMRSKAIKEVYNKTRKQ